jgi:hypothetical protein
VRAIVPSDPDAKPPCRIHNTMPTTFDKLNLKDHKEILVLNAPDTFEKEIRGLCDVRVFRRIEDMKALAFALSFVTQRAELHRLSRKLSAKASW